MPFSWPWPMQVLSERMATRGRHAVVASVRGRWLALVLLLCASAPMALSQSPAAVTLFGKVQDAQTKAALPFLTLQLQTERDSAFVGGRLTNE